MTKYSKFRNILQQLRSSSPTQCAMLVVGGACRDALVGVEPRDYDVLVNIQDPCSKAAFEYMSTWAAAISKSGMGSVEVYQAYDTYTGEENHFNKMYSLCAKVTLLDGTKLDLLFVKGTFPDTIHSFDSNVNMVYYNELTGRIERLGLPPEEGFFVRSNHAAGRVDKAFRHWQEHYQEDV